MRDRFRLRQRSGWNRHEKREHDVADELAVDHIQLHPTTRSEPAHLALRRVNGSLSSESFAPES